jgi:hypothetical protein
LSAELDCVKQNLALEEAGHRATKAENTTLRNRLTEKSEVLSKIRHLASSSAASSSADDQESIASMLNGEKKSQVPEKGVPYHIASGSICHYNTPISGSISSGQIGVFPAGWLTARSGYLP